MKQKMYSCDARVILSILIGLFLSCNVFAQDVTIKGNVKDAKGGELIETPQEDSPYGNRAFSEHGIIGMPAALGNALSRATGCEVNTLPVTEERLWQLTGGRL